MCTAAVYRKFVQFIRLLGARVCNLSAAELGQVTPEPCSRRGASVGCISCLRSGTAVAITARAIAFIIFHQAQPDQKLGGKLAQATPISSGADHVPPRSQQSGSCSCRRSFEGLATTPTTQRASGLTKACNRTAGASRVGSAPVAAVTAMQDEIAARQHALQKSIDPRTAAVSTPQIRRHTSPPDSTALARTASTNAEQTRLLAAATSVDATASVPCMPVLSYATTSFSVREQHCK